ncbi:hypothetical protein ACJ41O_006067 [Fusarium nematophilum]
MATLLADKACRACRVKKRRCDKRLPNCSLCRRVGRPCEYANAADTPPSMAEFEAMQARVNELEERLVSRDPIQMDTLGPPSFSVPNSTDWDPVSVSSAVSMASTTSGGEFPASLFLDIDCFRMAGHKMVVPSACIPIDVLSILGQADAVVTTCSNFYGTVHSWMPFISKKRMDLGISLKEGGPDLAMLFLAMRLCTCTLEEVEEGYVYSLAKNFLSTLDCQGHVSLLGLQASILVALYEWSHAIYPAAWMTVGACARYSQMLGLSCAASDVSFLRQPTTWTEVEERRRTWWAVFILDRVIVMGNRRPSVLAPPSPDDRLPVDDDAWSAGDRSAIGHPVSTHHSTHQGGFARLCQAALLVDRALVVARPQRSPSSSTMAEITVLGDDAISFCTIQQAVMSGQGIAAGNIGPLCLAISALFIVLDLLTCPEKLGPGAGYTLDGRAKSEEEVSMQRYALPIIERTSLQVHEMSVGLRSQLEAQEDRFQFLSGVCPFILDSMYCTAVTFHWYAGESGDRLHQSRAADLEACLEDLGVRWRLGRAYQKLISEYKVF